jgi:hypothetical protein
VSIIKPSTSSSHEANRYSTLEEERRSDVAEEKELVAGITPQYLATSRIGVLTPSEIGYIESAIRVFTTHAKEKIPQLENRDAVIESCEELREYLINNLTPLEQRY